MNSLLNCIEAQKEFLLKAQLNSELDYYSRHSSQIGNKEMALLAKLLTQKSLHNYIEQAEESCMLQLVIKGLMQKNYESMAEIVIVLEQRRVRDKYHLNLLFYLALVLLYKLKKTSSNAQTINKYINQLEEESKNYIPQLIGLPLDKQFTNVLIRCIQLYSGIFRNHFRQLAEYCITNQYPSLFAVLQWTFYEAKSGTHSYALQIQNSIAQIIDAFYVLNTLLDLDIDKQHLSMLWTNNLLSEDFKSNIQATLSETFSSKARFSLFFHIIHNELTTAFQDSENVITKSAILNKQEFLIQLLEALMNQVKEDSVVELNGSELLQRLADILKLNNPYGDYISTLNNSQHTVIVLQQLQNKLTKLQLDRKIQITVDQFKELHVAVKKNALTLLHILLRSSANEVFKTLNPQLNACLQEFQSQKLTFNTELILELSEIAKTMNAQQFLCFRIQQGLQQNCLDLLEQQFPKFMKDTFNFKKQEKLQVFKSVQESKSKRLPSKQSQKEFSLGLSQANRLTKGDIKLWQGQIKNWLRVLSQQSEFSLRYQMDKETEGRINQFIFLLFSFPFDQIVSNCESEIIIQIMHLCQTLVDNYTSSDHCLLQPITYFCNYLCDSAEFSEDLGLQQETQKLIETINLVRLNNYTVIVDNYQSTMKALNDQYMKAYTLFQSEEQFFSCKEPENMEHSERVNQIKKVKSLLVEDDSSQKQMKETVQSEEMFYSIQVHTPVMVPDPRPTKSQQQQQQQQQPQQLASQSNDEDIEMPQPVFD